MTSIYTINRNFEAFRRMTCDTPLDLAAKFHHAAKIAFPGKLPIRGETFEEDLAEELELAEFEEGDPASAETRRDNGFGDCIAVINFPMGLFFSERAHRVLANMLNATGECFPFSIDGSDKRYWLYHCTRVVDGVDTAHSTVHRLPDGTPSAFTNLVVDLSKVATESVFKLRWPNLSELNRESIALPIDVYVTKTFVDAVNAASLTGFVFTPVAATNG
jgi:hypothetical protein